MYRLDILESLTNYGCRHNSRCTVSIHLTNHCCLAESRIRQNCDQRVESCRRSRIERGRESQPGLGLSFRGWLSLNTTHSDSLLRHVLLLSQIQEGQGPREGGDRVSVL